MVEVLILIVTAESTPFASIEQKNHNLIIIVMIWLSKREPIIGNFQLNLHHRKKSEQLMNVSKYVQWTIIAKVLHITSLKSNTFKNLYILDCL